MPISRSSVDVGQQIQSLLELRKVHADAIAEIDQTLERVGAALRNSTPTVVHAAPRRGRPPKSLSAAPAAASTRRRRRSKYAMSGEESILAFVGSRNNSTTQDVKAHWAGEDRGGTADNALSQLVKRKKLKRIHLEGMRGSTYQLP